MNSFGLTRAPREIIVGAGMRRATGATAAGLGSRALVCTDARFTADPAFDEVRNSVASAGLEVDVFDGALPDVPVENVAEAFSAALAESPPPR